MDQTDSAKPGLDPESPLAVHSVSTMVGEYIGRLGTIWIEGQLDLPAEQRRAGALAILTEIEGRVVLECLGVSR